MALFFFYLSVDLLPPFCLKSKAFNMKTVFQQTRYIDVCFFRLLLIFQHTWGGVLFCHSVQVDPPGIKLTAPRGWWSMALYLLFKDEVGRGWGEVVGWVG